MGPGDLDVRSLKDSSVTIAGESTCRKPDHRNVTSPYVTAL